jgi:hypothetical protein
MEWQDSVMRIKEIKGASKAEDLFDIIDSLVIQLQICWNGQTAWECVQTGHAVRYSCRTSSFDSSKISLYNVDTLHDS